VAAEIGAVGLNALLCDTVVAMAWLVYGKLVKASCSASVGW
jgi:hypothetical protein